MDEPGSIPIRTNPNQPETNGDTPQPIGETPVEGNCSSVSISTKNGKKESSDVVVRRERPTRACTTRPMKYVDPPVIERRPRPVKRVKVVKEVGGDVEVEGDEEELNELCNSSGGVSSSSSSRVVTSLVNVPSPELLPRWKLRTMWEFASILNFLHVFRPLLNITVEFSAEELETSLLNPNATLGDVHIPLLKAIPPIARMACGRDTWVTVLCRKLRDWWHWVAEGELPIVASHGAEIEVYRNLDPGVRVVILKALCDIRVEQDDIKSYIDGSFKHGVQLSVFRKQRIGGDSHGISYWYEDDEMIGHRLYREIRKVEVKKGKTKGSQVLPNTLFEWETVATNLDEFVDVSEKLFSSKNRTEASLGKKLKNDMLPEIEKIHKRKEQKLKKQQRQALLLETYVTMDGLLGGRSLRDRKPVTYTFDDFDRSINEAIKTTTHKQPSPEPGLRREGAKPEPSGNGRLDDPSPASHHDLSTAPSPIIYDEMDEDHKSQPLDRSNRRRLRPQRFSEREFNEAGVKNEETFDSDDDIVGEAVYDDDYLSQHKHGKKSTSSSEGEGDEEYHWSEENGEDEMDEDEEDEEEDEDEDEDEEDSLSMSEDSDRPRRRFNRSEGQSRRGTTRSRSVDKRDFGLRRSKRATRNKTNYQQYEFSDSENETTMPETSESSEKHSDETDNADYSMESQDSEGGSNGADQGTGFDQSDMANVENDENESPHELDSPGPDDHDDVKLEKQRKDDQDGVNLDQDDRNGVGKRRFLDLNEVAPGSGFEDGAGVFAKDDNMP